MRAHRHRPRPEAGFSLIEGLFASVLVLVMMLFVLSLFTRAAIDTVSGKESSIATTHGKWTLEQLYQLPLDRAELTVEAGTLKETCAAWDRDAKKWTDYDCATGVPTGEAWARTTTLEQFHVGDLYDGDRTLANAVPAGTPPEFVHLRQLAVSIEGQRSGPLGPARQMDLVTIKSF